MAIGVLRKFSQDPGGIAKIMIPGTALPSKVGERNAVLVRGVVHGDHLSTRPDYALAWLQPAPVVDP
jgi:hypothetical protein